MDADQWDLYAVVRSFTTATRTATPTTDVPTGTIESIITTVIEDQLTGSYDLPGFWDTGSAAAGYYCDNNPFDELGKLYKPFIQAAADDDQSSSSPNTVTAGSLSTQAEIISNSKHRSLLHQQQLHHRAILIQQQQQQILLQRQHELQQFQQQQQQQELQQFQQQQQQQELQQFQQQQQLLQQYDVDHHHLQPDQIPHYRCRKRKNDQKRTTCQVTAENILATDKWAWRKYGQKPIKGSPYPRNYYRCSSSKGCTARKQVERSPTDPNVYVVTYTGDHCHPHPTHRNSLAGSTRTKFCVPNNKLPPAFEDSHHQNPKVSSPSSSSSGLSPATMEERDVKPAVVINTDGDGGSGGAEDIEVGSFEDELARLVHMVAEVEEEEEEDELYGFDDVLIPNRIVVDGDFYAAE